MKRRTLLLLLGGGGSAALSTGTGAFSSATADRSVEVSVVDDDNAYVGYSTPQTDEDNEIVVSQCGRVTLVRVTNRFPDEDGIGIVDVEFADDEDLFTDLAIERSDDDGRLDPYEGEGAVPAEYAFGPGEYADVTAAIAEYPGDPVDIEVTIRVRGAEDASVSAEIFGDTRGFTLVVDEEDGVEFKPGHSGIVVRATGNGEYFRDEGDIEGTIYYEENGGGSDPAVGGKEVDIPTNETLKPKDFDDLNNNGTTILGVGIDGVGVFDRGKAPTPGSSNNDNNRYGFVCDPVDLADASFYFDGLDDDGDDGDSSDGEND